MARRKAVNRLVIFAFPEQYKGTNKYYDWNGKITTDPNQAAQFDKDAHDEAREFAKAKGINLDSGGQYIALATFYE